MKNCINCGAAVEEDAKFCSFCGAYVEEKKIEEEKVENLKKDENVEKEPDKIYEEVKGLPVQDENNPPLKTTVQLVLSIIFIFGCTILAIPALIFTIIAENEKDTNYKKAKKYLHYAKIINTISIVLISFSILIALIFSALANLSNYTGMYN